jgi:hypothetical protein
MKIYLLYSNPYDEGAEICVYGVFSTEDRANKTLEVFSEVSKHELYISEMELDCNEKYFKKIESGYCLFTGYSYKTLGQHKWEMSRAGLDWFLGDRETENSVSDWGDHLYANIVSKSEEEAIEIADKILNEKKENYYLWEKPSTS